MKDIDARLWKIAIDAPELQEALIKAGNDSAGGYKLPLGNIREYIFSADIPEERREKTVQQIHDLDGWTLKEITKAFDELRVALTVKEAKGEELTPLEKTYKDADLTAFVLLGLRRWANMVSHEAKPVNPIEGSAEE